MGDNLKHHTNQAGRRFAGGVCGGLESNDLGTAAAAVPYGLCTRNSSSHLYSMQYYLTVGLGLSISPAGMRTMRPMPYPSKDLSTTRLHDLGLLCGCCMLSLLSCLSHRPVWPLLASYDIYVLCTLYSTWERVVVIFYDLKHWLLYTVTRFHKHICRGYNVTFS